MFRNTLTTNDKYSFRDGKNLSNPIQMQRFLIFLINFRNLHQISKVLQKKMIPIATLFRKLQTVKDLGRPLFKKHRFRTPFDSQHVKGSQTLAKCA